MDWVDYREALGIGFCDEDKFNLFSIKISNTLRSLYKACMVELSFGEYHSFCNTTGISINVNYWDNDYSLDRFGHVLDILDRYGKTLKEFLSLYIALLNSFDAEYNARNIDSFKLFLERALQESHIPFEVYLDDTGKYYVFPKGVPEFDKALITEPLSWLADYPHAEKAYITALKQYSEGIFSRDVADNLRKALEAFLQEFLGNTRNIESNKIEICRYLGGQGIDGRISGLYQTIINVFKTFNDESVKHNDKVDDKLLEFLLYQTGILIRMVLVVKQFATEATENAD